MKKRNIKYKLILLVIFIGCLMILGNKSNVYAMSAKEVQGLKSGDSVEVTKQSKMYDWLPAGGGKDIPIYRIALMPGKEDERIQTGIKLTVQKADGDKCYRKQGDAYYVAVKGNGGISCFIHFSNLKKISLTETQKNKQKEFLKKENVKKVKDGKAKDLSNEELVKIVEDATKISKDAPSEEIEQIENKAVLELQNRGYKFKETGDGGYVITDPEGETVGELEGGQFVSDDSVYRQPKLNNGDRDSAGSLDDMMSDADSFLTEGEIQYDNGALANVSSTLFNIFSIVGAAVALIVGIIIGIKYMMGSVEEKANYKQMLVPYIAGCIAVFGAFGIWKLLMQILETI